MMRKLDQRGVAAFEFCLVAVPLFTLMFVIFDLGRYAITVQSLWALADAEARYVAINCYLPDEVGKSTSHWLQLPGQHFPAVRRGQMQAVAPFLYAGGLTPTVSITAASGGTSPLTVTASQSAFTMLVPVWGTALNAPSVSTSIPF